MDNKIFSSMTIVDARMPLDYKEKIFNSNRHRFGSDLIMELLKYPSPFIVEFKDEYRPVEFMPNGDDWPYRIEHRISAKVQLIQYKEVVMETIRYISRNATFMEKIRWLFSK